MNATYSTIKACMASEGVNLALLDYTTRLLTLFALTVDIKCRRKRLLPNRFFPRLTQHLW